MPKSGHGACLRTPVGGSPNARQAADALDTSIDQPKKIATDEVLIGEEKRRNTAYAIVAAEEVAFYPYAWVVS